MKTEKPIFLFSDFGNADLYVGQVKTVLARCAPEALVVDLLHEAPAFNVRAGAHLLAALLGQVPLASVVLAVVDPGVGGARRPVAVLADERWLVGPDNGLLSVAVARAADARVFPVTWRPPRASVSFDGRDLFAPVAAMLARGELGAGDMEEAAGLDVRFGAEDLAEVIYVDHYGNAATGLRAHALVRGATLVVNGRSIGYARVFADVPQGEVFWYENSLGLAEIAANSASAARKLDLATGQRVTVG